MNRSSYSKHPFVPGLKGKAFIVSPLSMMLLVIVSILGRSFPLRTLCAS